MDRAVAIGIVSSLLTTGVLALALLPVLQGLSDAVVRAVADRIVSCNVTALPLTAS